MNFKVLLSGFVLSLSLTSLPAQNNADYKLGDPYKMPKGHLDYGFFQTPKGDFVQLSFRKRKDLTAQFFNADQYSILNQETMDLSAMSRKEIPERLVIMKGNFYWLFKKWDRSGRHWSIFAYAIDTRNMEMSQKPEVILQSDKLPSPGPGYIYTFSADSSKMLIHYRLKPDKKRDKKNHDKIGLYVFDQNMQKVWGANVKMPYTEAQMNALDYSVDKDGNVFLLARVFDNMKDRKEKRKDQKPKYHFELFRYAAGQKAPEIRKLDFDGKFINNPILRNSPQGELLVCGYYANKGRLMVADGAFVMKVSLNDQTFQPYGKGFFEFPASLVKEYQSKKDKKKTDKKLAKGESAGIKNLMLRDVGFADDGSITIVGEEFFVELSRFTWGVGVGTGGAGFGVAFRVGQRAMIGFGSVKSNPNYDLHYDNVLAMRIAPDGKLMWATKVPKRQTITIQASSIGASSMSIIPGAFSGYLPSRVTGQLGPIGSDLSFRHVSYNGEDYFLFLDNVKNLDLKKTELPKNHRAGMGGFFTCVKVDAKGKMNKSSIFDLRKEKLSISPMSFRVIGENKLVGQGYAKKNKKKVVEVTLQ